MHWWSVLPLLLMLSNGCGHFDQRPVLPGTSWAASQNHYHKDWTFLSADSVAIRFGQWGWSMRMDPAVIARDSLHLSDPNVVHYRMDADQLIVHGAYGSNERDTLTWDGERFVSNWTYT
jgi:hypothetical protein